MTQADRQIAALTREVGRLASMVEQLLSGNTRSVSATSLDLCLRSDDPVAAIREMENAKRAKKRQASLVGSSGSE